MRYFLSLLIVLLFVSCSGESEENKNKEKEIIEVEDSIPEFPDSLFTEMEDTLENEFFIENLPSKWVMLTDDTGNGEPLVIYDWCEAETPFFEFVAHKGEAWSIDLAYGQDGEQCEITFFEAFEEEKELKQVVSGTFRYQATYDESTRFCEFWWNKDTKVGYFDGMGMGSSWFVPEKDMINYEIVKEDCEGLWDE